MGLSPKQIDTITNIMGAVLVILEPIRSYLTTQPFEWTTFGICLLSAVVAYFTGKSAQHVP